MLPRSVSFPLLSINSGLHHLLILRRASLTFKHLTVPRVCLAFPPTIPSKSPSNSQLSPSHHDLLPRIHRHVPELICSHDLENFPTSHIPNGSFHSPLPTGSHHVTSVILFTNSPTTALQRSPRHRTLIGSSTRQHTHRRSASALLDACAPPHAPTQEARQVLSPDKSSVPRKRKTST